MVVNGDIDELVSKIAEEVTAPSNSELGKEVDFVVTSS